MTHRLLLPAFVLLVLAITTGGCGIGDAQTRLRTAIDAKRPNLNECYGAALARNRTAAGDMQLLVHVDESTGRIGRVEITRPGIEDPALKRCVETALVSAELSPPPNANLKVEYTLRFTPST